jgi:hypothetical protein
MRRNLFACLFLCVTALPGWAEERVLLYPQDLPASPTARFAAPQPMIEDLRRQAVEKGSVKVLIGTRVAFGAEGLLEASEAKDQRAEIATAAQAIRERFADAIRRAPDSFRSYDSIPFVTMEVTADELDRLAEDPDVISIVENMMFEPMLPESLPMVQGNQAHAAGFTGAGQTVAIIDTGVDKNHPFVSGRVVAEACFSQSRECPGRAVTSTAPGSGMPCGISGCDHGTHVAGIAAGAASSTNGVANAANIIAIQVFSNSQGRPTASFGDILAGLEHVYGLRSAFSIASVNMSLGGSRFFSVCDGNPSALPIAAAIRNLRSAGIATVVASGNEGYTDSLSFPACISSAVSVGSVSDTSWGDCPPGQPAARDKVACYSNSASFLDLLAPGSRILSSVPGNSYSQKHGTSMAAPHVAGAWAVLKQKAPGASVDEILAVLRSTGTSVVDYRNGIAKPRINVKAALDQLTSNMPVLAYTKTGLGRGTVTFSPAGSQASCSATCSSAFATDTVVTLTAAPENGSVFTGWSGNCSGTESCQLTMSEARQVTAGFAAAAADARVLSYSKQGTGGGIVTFSPAGSNASCSETCTTDFEHNTMVTLVARALEGSVFRSWSGACRGKRACRIRMDTARTVTALFDAIPVHTLSYRVEGSGTGKISFTRPSGLGDCTASCTRNFSTGSRVTLTAQANTGSRFVGWSGSCRGRRTCSLNMRNANTAVATFETVPVHVLTFTQEGQGTVTFTRPANEAACTGSCTRNFTGGTRVTLRAVAAPGYRFSGWQDGCRGRRTCNVVLSSPKSVTAVFTPLSSASSSELMIAE